MFVHNQSLLEATFHCGIYTYAHGEPQSLVDYHMCAHVVEVCTLVHGVILEGVLDPLRMKLADVWPQCGCRPAQYRGMTRSHCTCDLQITRIELKLTRQVL